MENENWWATEIKSKKMLNSTPLHDVSGNVHIVLDEILELTCWGGQFYCLTDPEVSHCVDFHCLFNQGIRSIHEFLSSHNPSIVHQNADVTCLSFHLHGAKEMQIYSIAIFYFYAYSIKETNHNSLLCCAIQCYREANPLV